MTVASPNTAKRIELARRLRDLRLNQWPRETVTQRMLAEALGGAKPRSVSLISAWENENNSITPQPAQLHDYATFFVTRRSVAGGHGRLIPDDELTADEIAARDELYQSLLSLRRDGTDLPAPTTKATIPFDWRFPDNGKITIVCGKLDDRYKMHPYTQPAHPNYTELLTFADADALVELFGHVRKTNPDNDVRFFRSDRLATAADSADELASHLVLLGGIALNTLTEEVFSTAGLPIRQIPIADPDFAEWGEGFEVIEDDKKIVQPPLSAPLTEDVGLLARMPNPFNSSTTLTICNGVFASGVLGAVRTLTDDTLRGQNERYLAARFGGQDRFAILMRVPLLLGATMTPDLQNESMRLFEWPDNAVL
jgi:hypothetical protein